jgi:hypothetical protein
VCVQTETVLHCFVRLDVNNIRFGSGLHGLAFSLKQFAEMVRQH